MVTQTRQMWQLMCHKTVLAASTPRRVVSAPPCLTLQQQSSTLGQSESDTRCRP